MPVINDILLEIDFEEIGKSLPFLKSERSNCYGKELAQNLVLQIEDNHILEPLASYENLRIIDLVDDKIYLEGGEVITGSLPASLFKSARELVFLVFTLGKELDELEAYYSRNKEIIKSVLLGEMGNYWLHTLSLKVFKIVKEVIETKGLFISNPLAPGFSGFPCEEQGKIFRLANGKNIGMRLTTGFMLYPRNSLSMVTGVSDISFNRADKSICYYCQNSENCQYSHEFSL